MNRYRYRKPTDSIPWMKLVSHFKKKLQGIKVFLIDVDGILTDGHVSYEGAEMGFNRNFHVADGYAIKFLMAAGIKVGVLSGGNSLGLKMRMENLGPNYFFMGNEDKRGAYLHILKDTGCQDHEVLYIADELFDLPILRRVGFSATVPHAPLDVKKAVDYITTREGGMGSMREVADLVRFAQNFQPHFPEF